LSDQASHGHLVTFSKRQFDFKYENCRMKMEKLRHQRSRRKVTKKGEQTLPGLKTYVLENVFKVF